jgi:hypothetical protein
MMTNAFAYAQLTQANAFEEQTAIGCIYSYLAAVGRSDHETLTSEAAVGMGGKTYMWRLRHHLHALNSG